MRRIALAAVIVAVASTAWACFGSELVVGYLESSRSSQVAAVLVEQYVKEKTRIDVKLVPLKAAPSGDGAKAVDLVMFPFAAGGFTEGNLARNGVRYAWRTEIREDLRFTTIRDALASLAAGMTQEDVAALDADVQSQGKMRKTVQDFLKRKGLWP